MANTGKYAHTAVEIQGHAAIVEALFAIKPEIKPTCFFEVGEVCALLRVDAKTLQRKRKQRDALLEKGEDPDPLDISSIPYVPPRPAVTTNRPDSDPSLGREAGGRDSCRADPARGAAGSAGASSSGSGASD